MRSLARFAAIGISGLVLVVLIPIFIRAEILTGLSVNCRPATEAELDALGLPPDSNYPICPKDTQAGVTQDAGEAKQYLYQTRCNGRVDIARLDNKFAICAAKFVKELRSVDGSTCINSAFRNPIQQANACRGICGNPNGCRGTCAPPGSSYHQKGLAIDMKYRISNQTMWTIAARSGLHNPPGLHRSDPIHVQASGASNCAGIPVHLGDGGDYYNDRGGYFAAPPADYQAPTGQQSNQFSPQPPPQQAQNPSEQKCALPDGTQVPCSAIANRNNPPTTGASGPTGNPIPPQNLPQTQQPLAQGTCAPQFYCKESTYYYRTSFCVDQVYQKCPAGCSSTGNACASTSTSESQLSAFDQIGLLAEPTSTPSGAVSDLLFELAIGGEETASLEDVSGLRPTTTAGGAISYVAPTQQTFVSGDLRYSQAQYQPQLSTLQRTLATMKDILLRALAYLRPFGRPYDASAYYE